MAADSTLISIRERRQIDLFDLALLVIRRRPWPLACAAMCGFVPFLALNAWVFGRSGAAGPVLGLLLWWFEAPFATAPLTIVLGGMMFGQTPAPRTVARALGRSVGTLIVTHGILRFLPFFWLPPRLAFANEVVLLEHAGWNRHWKRGADLVGGRDGDLFFLTLFQAAAVWLFAILAYYGIGRLLQAVLNEKLTWNWYGATITTSGLFQILIWVGVSYLAVVRFLTYIDQRIRLEGWEIKLRLHAVGTALREGRRW